MQVQELLCQWIDAFIYFFVNSNTDLRFYKHLLSVFVSGSFNMLYILTSHWPWEVYHLLFIDNTVLRFSKLFQKVRCSVKEPAILLLWGRCSLVGGECLAGSSHPYRKQGQHREEPHLPPWRDNGKALPFCGAFGTLSLSLLHCDPLFLKYESCSHNYALNPMLIYCRVASFSVCPVVLAF